MKLEQLLKKNLATRDSDGLKSHTVLPFNIAKSKLSHNRKCKIVKLFTWGSFYLRSTEEALKICQSYVSKWDHAISECNCVSLKRCN